MSKSSLMKGFLRLCLVLFLVMVGVNSIALFKECHENADLFVLQHLAPRYGTSFFNEESWCSIIAKPDFLKKPIEERVRLAETFFNENIERFVINCLDISKFRSKFISSAKLTLEEAPIRIWEKHGDITYRDISSYSWHEGFQIWRIAINWGVLLIAAIEGVLMAGIITGLIALYSWIKKGFKGTL